MNGVLRALFVALRELAGNEDAVRRVVDEALREDATPPGLPSRYVPESLRAFVIGRDGYVCGICRGPVDPSDVHLDHIIALSRGGPTTAENLRVTHSVCNIRKGARPE